MKRAGPVTLVLVALALVLALAACTLQGTPRNSLAMLHTALLNHNASEALRFIDVDSIVDHLFARNAPPPDDLARSLKLELGRGIAQFMLPSVKRALTRQIRNEIASGGEEGYFEYIRRGSVWYMNITEEGTTALVEPKGKSRFKFRMERMPEGHWKIVQILPGKE